MNSTERILEFVSTIGLTVHERACSEATFLPGIVIDAGTLVIDRNRLAYPGDVLHEAGHIAITAPSQRCLLSENLTAGPGEEMASIAWSWAAVVHLGIDPSVLFHGGGYKNDADSLLENFRAGRYIGVPLLQWYGMTWERSQRADQPVYPRMTSWLRTREEEPVVEKRRIECTP